MRRLEHVIVVGANVAGLGAVDALRRSGYEGRLTLVGDEPHLPYNRPPLSKAVLAGSAAPESTALLTPDRLERLDVELRLGVRATRLDLGEQVAEVGAEALRFDGLVVATGASPRRLTALEGLDGVLTLRTLDDAVALRDRLARAQRLVVVGAGFVGAGVAATARGLGVEVTIVELAQKPLAHALGRELGEACARLHGEHGVDLRCGRTVTAVEGKGRVERVTLSDGATLDADLLLVAVGAVPSTGWLADSGLELRDGVVCDRTLNAGHPAVYAAGDVARWQNELFGRELRVEHWTNAGEQGVHAAESLLAGSEQAAPFLGVNYVWSDQYGLRIQFAGTVTDDVEVIDGSLAGRSFLAWYRSAGRIVGAVAIGSPQAFARSRRLIRQRAAWAEGLGALAA